eukprot:8669031-Pyramimonas_sp.AAC.1
MGALRGVAWHCLAYCVALLGMVSQCLVLRGEASRRNQDHQEQGYLTKEPRNQGRGTKQARPRNKETKTKEARSQARGILGTPH